MRQMLKKYISLYSIQILIEYSIDLKSKCWHALFTQCLLDIKK